MTCAWIDTSSADTGSSQTISLRPQRDRARDADALALAAGELVRVAVVVLRVQADPLDEVLDLGLDAALGPCPLDAERRADDRADRVPRVQRRVGVLEDHLHVAAQIGRICRAARWLMSRPSNPIVPAWARAACVIERPAVDLPQPDSPTRPSVSPRRDVEGDAVDRLDRADLAPEEDALR